MLAVGSTDRTFESDLTADRLAQAQALIGTTALFCDWARPVPDARQATLLNVEEVGDPFAVICTGGITKMKVRARFTLVSD